MIAAGTRFGAYEVPRPLGALGIGEVYAARHTRCSIGSSRSCSVDFISLGLKMMKAGA